mmetsp:Transcript_89771/g.290003  ORF Transcript_89771/g.290003 Transcript_89771/m.290003 type:complete len:104 (+) Transcript_89771:237-548(+)
MSSFRPRRPAAGARIMRVSQTIGWRRVGSHRGAAAPRAAPALQQVASMAGAAALSLVADPAFASDYDDRQGTAALALVGVCILGVVVSGIFFLVGKTVVERDD